MVSKIPVKKSSSLEAELKELFLESRKGNQESYQDFLGKISILLRAYFRKATTKSTADTIEDLLQETLISIHSKKHLYDDTQKISPWIYSIAKYRLIDAHRKKKVRQEVFGNEDEFENMFASEGDPESQLQLKESSSDGVEALLSELTDQQRLVLKLAKVEEKSIAEISKQTGLSSSAVKVTIHRALEALRKQFSGQKEKI